MEMVGLDVIGAGKKASLSPHANGLMDKIKAHATYVGAGLGAVVGVLLMAYTGKHAGSRWTGRAILPLMRKPVSALVKNGTGAVLGATVVGVGAHYLQKKEGW